MILMIGIFIYQLININNDRGFLIGICLSTLESSFINMDKSTALGFLIVGCDNNEAKTLRSQSKRHDDVTVMVTNNFKKRRTKTGSKTG